MSIKYKHTPGPWHVQAKAGRVYIQAANYRTMLATCAAFNADLIAAAPELLAALIDAESMLDQIRHTRFLENDTWDAIDKTVDAARTAIAKAVQS